MTSDEESGWGHAGSPEHRDKWLQSVAWTLVSSSDRVPAEGSRYTARAPAEDDMPLSSLLIAMLACQTANTPRDSSDDTPTTELTGPVVAIDGPSPSSDEDLVALLLVPGSSSTGGTVEHHFRWSVDGEALVELDDLDTVPASQTQPDETWALQAWASQGDLASADAWDEVVVLNALPELSATISPETATSADDLEVTVEAWDPDGGSLEILYTWFLDRDQQPELMEASVPASETGRDQEWICQVLVTDEHGGQAESWLLAQVVNSAPSLLGATIAPQPLTTDDDIECVPVGFEDVDDDPPHHAYQWTVTTNGESCSCHSEEPDPVLSSAFTSPGTTVTCEVTPSDGELAGSTVHAAEVEVEAAGPSFY
jgi:hypothetical protein